MYKLIILSILFLSCTSNNLSKNHVRRAEVNFYGGVAGKDQWGEPLEFRRAGFYKELLLMYDVLITKVDKNSPFMKWFSPGEAQLVDGCPSFFIVLDYSYQTPIVPILIRRTEFKNQMIDQGFEDMIVYQFSQNIKLHPDFTRLNFHQYYVTGYCHQDPAVKKIDINLPGFPHTRI